MKALLCAAALLLFVSNNAFPKGMGAHHYGGVGFLYQDMNEFTNPGQKANVKGVSVQAEYSQSGTADTKTARPSIVWGNGSVGLGGYVNRTGTDLMDPATSTDSIGGALGIGIANNRVTMGVGYDRSIDVGQDMDGTIRGSINFNGNGSKGFNLGMGASQTVNRALRDVKTGTVAIGYGFTMVSLEADYTITDFDDPANNNDVGGYLSFVGKTLYLGVGGGQTKPDDANYLTATLGLKFKAVDFSFFGHHVFKDGLNPTMGSRFRIIF